MTILGRFFRWISGLWNSLEKETKVLVPIAINVVEGIKVAMDNHVDDILIAIIGFATKGVSDPIAKKVDEVVKEWLPKVLLELNIVESIANIQDPNAQLQAILDQIKLSSDETQSILYHGLCSMILEKLSDGKITWSESVELSQYYFDNFVKK